MSLLIDLTHTSHTRSRTGIQRVCRSLHVELSAREPVRPLCFDPYRGGWRDLRARERAALGTFEGSARSRGARWSLSQRVLGRIRRLACGPLPTPEGEALIAPEFFSSMVGTQLPSLLARVRGPRVAVFHDAIGLKYPELTPGTTVARLPGYLRELAAFDGVAAVSEDSAASLRDFWAWAGLADAPPVVAIPLGVDPAPPAPNAALPDPPRVLCVATIEARKNHLALLAAAEALWTEGLNFQLELVGLARPETGAAALDRIRRLTAKGRPLAYHGAVTEDELRAAYARCTFTVYPSIHEGFGLPVLESLAHGRPCLTSRGGALAEMASGGGVELLSGLEAPAVAAGLRELLLNPAKVEALATAARRRKLRSWRDYTSDLRAWMAQLSRRH